MRILSLRFKNLNSLAGEWKIDFTDPEYVSSGIFAITGPTGAGKSTILDAISLALYGRTPRLGKISKNAVEIMSRQTGDYFSEVEFVSDKGHFRVIWSQKRAHKKPGDLQPPKHEIVDVKTGVPLESKQMRVQQKVIEVTGLDYQQFTRSILLAQGEFATFLEANAEERAPILEKITGTEIYGQISIKVHERFGREKKTLDELNSKAENIEMITPEQAEALQNEKKDREKEIHKISVDCKNLEIAVTWLDTIAALKEDVSGLQVQQLAFIAHKEAVGNDLDALSNARKARKLEGVYTGLSALRTQQESDSQEKKTCEEQLEGLNTVNARAFEVFISAQEKRDAALQEKQHEDEILRQVRELDTRIREFINKRDEREHEKQRTEEDIKNYQQAIRSVTLQSDEIQQKLRAATAYLEKHSADQKLIESLSGIESAFSQLDTILQTTEQTKQELIKKENLLAKAEESLLFRKKDVDKLTEALQHAINEAERTKNEFATISGGRDIGDMRERFDTIKEQHSRLRSLLDLFTRSEEDAEEFKRHSKIIATALSNRTEEETQHRLLQKEEEQIAHLEQLAEKKLFLEARIKKLEQERENLTDGEPCPLCGSTDHPWSSGISPVPDTAQQELDAYKTALDNVREKIRKNEATLATIEAEVRTNQFVADNLDRKIKSELAELQRESDNLGLIAADKGLRYTITTAFAEYTARLENEREILKTAEEKEQQIRFSENCVNQERSALAGAQNEYGTAQSYRDMQIRDRNRISDEITENNKKYARQKAAILDVLQKYEGVIMFSAHEMAKQVMTELTERRDAYVAALTKQQDLEKSFQQCEAELQKNQALLSVADNTLMDFNKILADINEDLKSNSVKRQELYGEKDTSIEEARFASKIDEAVKELSAANDAKNLADNQKSSCETQIKTLSEKITRRISALQEKEREFSHVLSESGFFEENQFISARLPPDKLAVLEQLEADLIREETRIFTGLREKSTKLAEEEARSLTTARREDLTIDIENKKNRIADLQIDIGRLKTNLEQYEAQVVKHQALKEEIARQEKEFIKWQKLHDLIGSADGKKFRVFAQGLTFETLVAQANRHLRTMSDRYLLVRNKESPLDLDIMDNYQAGEIRTTDNLSGGEKFIVSLALALGLSGMASHNVRIDSLFLDEGFGTLDPETLETALETLSSLQREGKIIAIISHIPALRERIPVQIQVEKIGGGRSRLSGPGCSGPA